MTSIKNKTRQLETKKGGRLSIFMRTMLLGWGLSIVPLLVFMVITVPSQKDIFVNTLASKAKGLAASLHDVAASAAVNEDYSSVVSSAQVLLKGDADIDFLIIMKNDGFALVIEQKKWEVAQLEDSHLVRPVRETSWEIELSPLFQRRVFHFAQPFDYSGIQWGWIHVGLSLEEYDKSVSGLYKSTIVVALTCIFISLLGAIAYARQIVRPILALQTLVQKIAGGDLSVRAKTRRKDELGALAVSVNVMADALLKRNNILESVRFAAYHFLQDQVWKESIVKVLEDIGKAAGISRAVFHGIVKDDAGSFGAKKRFEWTAPGISPEQEDPEDQMISFEKRGVAHWADSLAAGRTLSVSLQECSDAEQILLTYSQIQSLILIPVFVEGIWWGIFALEDCDAVRKWTAAEISCFMALADMLGATVARQGFQKDVIKARDTLELQVKQRTRELEDQVQAKEEALSELSVAQTSLLEASRAAGMAEVATGVLHNVGNVLNSVNVSATLILDALRESRVGNLSKIAGMMDLSPEDLAQFMARDPKGQQIPKYLISLGNALADEHSRLFSETEALAGRIEHIKEIVAMQQNYGRVSGISETISPEILMEDALMLNQGALVRHNVTVKKEYEDLPDVVVDKHKVLQILLNFINNAKYACSESEKNEKLITLGIYKGQGATVCFSVADNGVGIAPENLTRIFQHGFTTRKSGHGFGLHSGALAAKEIGGRLRTDSKGPGQGAVFILELPAEHGTAAS
ncbi:ATP-binding protein [uncultured Desulfobacter sp.]|uniref:ATP-binding protein n=1 Tax=uncultured Desulfobacter sp. TaxID=240139 RepID=UPI0029F45877|nr:ATP-binding protein [uncultured Desulfobacter sp.]